MENHALESPVHSGRNAFPGSWSRAPVEGAHASSIAVSVGDTFTIKRGSYTLVKASNFNPSVTQTFTGGMFITNQAGATISITTVVPEPATLSLLVGPLAVLALIRRRAA